MVYWRIFHLLAIMLCSGLVRSQDIRLFDVSKLRDGWRNSKVQFFPHGTGVLAFISQDTTKMEQRFEVMTYYALQAVVVTPDGIEANYLVDEDGWYSEWESIRSNREYVCSVDDAMYPDVAVLCTMVSHHYSSLYHGRKVVSQLYRLKEGRLVELMRIPMAYNARMLLDGSKGRWIVWENYRNPDGRDTTFDRRYYSTINARRIDATGLVGETHDLGAGYDPVLMKESDGNIRLVYRSSMHGQSTEGVSLHTIPLGMDGTVGENEIIATGLTRIHSDKPFVAVMGSDDEMHILWPGKNAYLTLSRETDGTVHRCGEFARSSLPLLLFTINVSSHNIPVIAWYAVMEKEVRVVTWEEKRRYGTTRQFAVPLPVQSLEINFDTLGESSVIIGETQELYAITHPFHPEPTKRRLFAAPNDYSLLDAHCLTEHGALWVALKAGKRSNIAYIENVPLLECTISPPESMQRILSITPNPATHTLRVLFSNNNASGATVRIRDILGRVQREHYVNSLGDKNTQAASFDLTGLNKGAYILELHSEKWRDTRMFTVL